MPTRSWSSLMLVYIAQLVVSWLVHGPWKDPAGLQFSADRDVPGRGAAADAGRGHAAQRGVPARARRARSPATSSWTGASRASRCRSPAVRGCGPLRRVLGAADGLDGPPRRRRDGGHRRHGAKCPGRWGSLTEHVSSGYGFAAIIVAFVGRLNPVGIFFASLLMALLYLGGEQAQQYLSLPSSISKVFQGMLLFFLLGADVFVNYRLRFGARGGLRRDHGRRHLTAILVATIVAGTPLVIAALGELVTEKSGVLNLGAEGIMAVGAVAAFAAAHHSGQRLRSARSRASAAGALMSLALRVPDADADGEPGRVGARAVDLRRRALGVHRQGLRVGDAAGGAAAAHSAAGRHPGARPRDVRPAGARLPVVAAVRGHRLVPVPEPAGTACCARSASRRRRRTRSATR